MSVACPCRVEAQSKEQIPARKPKKFPKQSKKYT